MPQIQVGLGTIVENEHFAMLKGVHSTGIDIDIGVALNHIDFQTPFLQQKSQRGRGNSFSQR